MLYHALLIDDDVKYCESFKKEASKHLINVLVAHNLEEGIELVSSNRRILTVILDGHCFLSVDQKGDPKANFVYHAFHDLDNIEFTQRRVVPRCVNSESPDSFKEELNGLYDLFDKNQSVTELFAWIRRCIAERPETAVREAYASVFENSEFIFTDEEEAELIDLFMYVDLLDTAEIPGQLAIIRRLLEKLADYACIRFLGKDPVHYASMKGSSVRAIFDALESKGIIHSQIRKISGQLYTYCSAFGNHVNRPKVPAYKPSIYSFQANLFLLAELIVCIAEIKEGVQPNHCFMLFSGLPDV